MGPDKETAITAIASSILRRFLAFNNRNLMVFVTIDVDVDAGAADTRGTPV
jgi:hypothetical protein